MTNVVRVHDAHAHVDQQLYEVCDQPLALISGVQERTSGRKNGRLTRRSHLMAAKKTAKKSTKKKAATKKASKSKK